jgi:penicillin-binding protein 1C
MSMRFPKLFRIFRRLAVLGLFASAVLAIVWLLMPRAELYPPGLTFSTQVLDRDGQLLNLGVTSDEKYRIAAHYDAISEAMIRATLEKEDRRFFSHSGADPRSLIRAAWGAVSGQKLGGASTLTMQYARLRWRLNTRSFSGKLTQIVRAVQLERHFGKREILEAYFTLAPYGGNVEGVEAASRLWCGKAARELTLREAVALSVIPQRPAMRKPRRDNSASQSAQARLMARLTDSSDSMDAEFRLTPIIVPRMTPHFARRVEAGTTAQTTFDRSQQFTIERSIAEFLARWHPQGLRNSAAILVHAPTRQVRAYVGSAGFLDERISGQVDGVTSRRSPGSALKPFVYALSLDQGLIHPHTLLDDTARRFGSYNPENSDRGFLGPIAASEALRRSRNVPVVELASRLNNPGLDSFLRSAGVKFTKPRGDYGLSLTLGGGEVTLEELARLYTMLASDGVSRPLVYASGDSAAEQPPCLSEAARTLTLDALRDNSRAGTPRGLAWKTGTSHGFRDAWACGVIGDWVLCVWVGHFDGKAMPGLFARDTAAPLLFQTVQRLGLHAAPRVRPPEIVDVAVCADSGCIAGKHCPNRIQGPFIAGVSPITECDVHRLVDGMVRECWPEHRLEQFRRAGMPRGESPTATASTPPRIVSPQGAITYVVRAGQSESDAIPLEAEAAAGTRQVHWFEGRRYLGASAPAQPLLWRPSPGRWSLQAIDDTGRVSRVAVNVTAQR